MPSVATGAARPAQALPLWRSSSPAVLVHGRTVPPARISKFDLDGVSFIGKQTRVAFFAGQRAGGKGAL